MRRQIGRVPSPSVADVPGGLSARDDDVQLKHWQMNSQGHPAEWAEDGLGTASGDGYG